MEPTQPTEPGAPGSSRPADREDRPRVVYHVAASLDGRIDGFTPKESLTLDLRVMERLDNDVVWLRYDVRC